MASGIPAAASVRGPGARVAERRHLDLLDFAKGLAILLVFGHHLARTLSMIGGRPFPILLQWSFEAPDGHYAALANALTGFHLAAALELALGTFGYIGVHIFVVASGFGLAYGASPQRLEWSGFVFRRLRKLVPAFWIVVAGHAFLLALTTGEWMANLKTFLWKASLLSFFDHRTFFSLNSPLWFLGLIIPLYMVFPFLYRYAADPGRWRTLGVLLVVATATRWLFETPPLEHWHAEMGHAFFVTRLPEFFLGTIMGILGRNQQREVETSNAVLLAASAAGVAVAILAHLFRGAYPLLDPAFGLLGAAGTVLLYRASGQMLPLLVTGFAWLGQLSYAVYLIHRPIILFASNLLRPAFGPTADAGGRLLLQTVDLVVLFGVTLVVAWIFHVSLVRFGLLPALSRPASVAA